MENLNIERCVIRNNDCAFPDNIEEIIAHPSVQKIKQNVRVTDKFQFIDTTSEDIKNEILQLDPTKASIGNDIPYTILKKSSEVVSGYLADIYNNCKYDTKYPLSLKIADVIPMHKKEERTLLKNYRPVSLIPIVSKLFERNMHNQVVTYIDRFSSPYLFGYRKGYNTEQCLTTMLEDWRTVLDEKKCAGAVLTDLSKAFDCLSHELLIAKLTAYGFDKTSPQPTYNNLKTRKQRTKINCEYSTWSYPKYGVPQGSIIRPLLFIIFINDIFFFLDNTKMASYADDNTIYAVEDNINNLLKTLEMNLLLF